MINKRKYKQSHSSTPPSGGWGAILTAFIHKEFLHVFRDKRTLLIMFGLPIAQLLIFGYALTNEVKNARLLIVNPSSDVANEQLIQKKIGIAPSQLFRSEQVSQNFIRLNCSFAWTAEIEHAVTVLAQVIQQHITQHIQTQNY